MPARELHCWDRLNYRTTGRLQHRWRALRRAGRIRPDSKVRGTLLSASAVMARRPATARGHHRSRARNGGNLGKNQIYFSNVVIVELQTPFGNLWSIARGAPLMSTGSAGPLIFILCLSLTCTATRFSHKAAPEEYRKRSKA